MCSIFGVIATKAVDPNDIILYSSILAADTQHRGDAWVGIAYSEGSVLRTEKRAGRVTAIFNDPRLMKKMSDRGVQMIAGQTRFPTQGDSIKINAQPYYFRLPSGTIALGSNGDTQDYSAEKLRQQALGIKHITTNDAEVLLSEIWLTACQEGRSYSDGIIQLMKNVPATFSAWMTTEAELYLFRDPSGNRPLFYMQVGSFFVFASEDCALQGVLTQRAADGHQDGTVDICQVLPGESILISIHGSVKPRQLVPARKKGAMCVFERVYLARPDSLLFGADNLTQSIYYKVRVRLENGNVFFDPLDTEDIVDIGSFRYELGKQLAIEHPAPEAEFVIPIPDSGNMAALGYASKSGLSMKIGLVRNLYVGRTFIASGRESRELLTALKYRPMLGLFRSGRPVRMVVVDDSIVFGTSSYRVDQMLHARGAVIDKRISCPPIKYPCFSGVDMSSKGELIAATKTIEEMEAFYKVASLRYLSIEGLRTVLGAMSDHYCFACWNGDYPITASKMLK